MIKLIKLERQHLHLKTYVMTSLILGLFILVFTYFVANVAQIEQETEFMVYENIFLFSSIISTLLFGILSATMYNIQVNVLHCFFLIQSIVKRYL